MMRASRHTVCGFAVALGIGAAVLTTQCGTAWATPSDTSSKDHSSGAPPNSDNKQPSDPTTSDKRPGRPNLLRAAGRLAAALPAAGPDKPDSPTPGTGKQAKTPLRLGRLNTPRLSISALKIHAPASLDATAAIASLKLTKPAIMAELTKSLPFRPVKTQSVQIDSVQTPKLAPTQPTVRSFVSALASSVLSPLADASGIPAPVDSPAAWTVMAFARRELLGGTAPTLTSAVTPQSVLTSLVSPVATVIFDVFDPAFAAVAGPPILPPGSTVTVQSSTLQFDNGYVAPANWYFPEDPENAQGIIYLQHGFLAQGPIYSYTAAALAEQTNSIVVAPTITSNFFAADGNWLGGSSMPASAANLFEGNREALVTSAAAAGYDGTLPQKVVLVGHSLGGGFVEAMAGDMVDNGTADDLAGVILLDGVAFDPTVPATALGKLDTLPNTVPVLLIASDPYFWNLYGQMSEDLTTLRPGQFNGVQLVGGKHIDGLQGGNPLIQVAEYVFAGFSKPQNIEAVKILSIEWINDMYAGTPITAPSDQPFVIPTTAGPATANSIPAPGMLSPVDQLLKSIELLGTSIFLSN